MSERRVLVIRGGAIGDFVLTLPVFQLLRDSIPGVEIHAMGNRGIVELAAASGHAEAIHYLDTQGMAMLFAKGAPVDERLAAWLSSYNLVVSYLYDPDGIFRENVLKAGVKTLLDAPHRVQEGQGHATAQLACPLERLAMFLEPDASPQIQIKSSEYAPDARVRIAIHPGSGSIKKNWPMEHWARVGPALLEARPEAQLVLITGEAERERGVTDFLAEAWSTIPFVHWDALPLAELASRFPQCTHFLGHDSGMTHLAAACGVASHAFFGPTDPATWAPRGKMATVFRAPGLDLSQLDWETGWSALASFIEDSRR